MQPGSKTVLLGGLTAAVLLGGFVYLHVALVEVAERTERTEARLVQLEKSRTAGEPAPVATRVEPAILVEEFDRLRAEVADLRRLLSSPAAAPGKTAAVSPDRGGEATADAGGFPPERVAALKKVIEDTLEEREKGRRSQWAGMTEEWMKQRRQQALDELEQRLRLSAYQKEQVDQVAQEQGKVAAELMAGIWSGSGAGSGSANREDSRKRFSELETTTDTKVKQLLTAQQAVDYDKWKEETGGWRGGGGLGRGATRVGGGGSGQASGEGGQK